MDNVIVSVEVSKNNQNTLLELINNFKRFQIMRLICKSKLHFYIIAMNNWDQKFNAVSLALSLKKVKHLGIS